MRCGHIPEKSAQLRTVLVIVIAAIGLSVARPHLQKLLDIEHHRLTAGAEPAYQQSGAGSSAEHFSPAENLEELDIGYLRQARETVDVAMFSFTDRRIAEVLKELAVGHVRIRIYRDQGQFREEQERASRFGGLSTSLLLRGSVNIQIRVKQGPEGDLMHSKAFCLDHRLLRDGSANWSRSGEMTQDNQIRVTTDPRQIAGFEKTFEGMWSRPSNLVIQ
jgi:phosphatidylserine/phosphatidylglycerophosphate/cardiolipin synthase-like enzyme